jgi:hypothetical protein
LNPDESLWFGGVRSLNVADRKGGGFGPVAQAKLGENACDVMLDGLAAEVEALGDLGI